MAENRMKVMLVGNPNVGKSALFNGMTGKYVSVSNYPGTTVEVTEGLVTVKGKELEIIDTPGMYSMLPISEEEKVSRDLILKGGADRIVNVIDAKNLERMLPLTFQLIETGIPVMLVLNMMDETERRGFYIDTEKLSAILGIPVVPAVSIKKIGIDKIFENILSDYAGKSSTFVHDADIARAAGRLQAMLTASYPVSSSIVALLLLQKDREMTEYVLSMEGNVKIAEEAERLAHQILVNTRVPVDYSLALERQMQASQLVKEVVRTRSKPEQSSIVAFLGWITVHPVLGYPVLIAVLYLGLYKFVGVFGAGYLVNFIENDIFGELLLPTVNAFIERTIPYETVKDLLIRDYGIITLGIKYAVAIILPIVTLFFLFFSILEDSGYLPRLALLLDRMFKKIGMTGKAVIPMVLGFGCDTMATMVTRTLNTKKERLIATILLSLAVPCSAQLGVMLSVLSHSGTLLAVWVFLLLLIFMLVGYLSSKLIQGEKNIFFVEIPPVRIPRPYNIFVKTYTRLIWYFKEVMPLFIYASFFIWIGRITGLFNLAIDVIAVPIRYMGLPRDAAQVFLFGFFRRDYGAAGLYDMHKQGLFDNNQLLILAMMLTLFLPCIAQFIMTIKERGLKTGMSIAGFVFAFSLAVGYFLHIMLGLLGVQL